MQHRLTVLVLALVLLLPLPGRAADLDVMVGQMLMAGFRGFTAPPDSRIARDIRDYHLGGVVLFDYDVALDKPERNIQSPEQVTALNTSLQSYAQIPLFIGVDQEGGAGPAAQEALRVPRDPLGPDPLHGRGVQGAHGLYMVGSTCAANGFNLDFAPVVDVNVNPDSPAIGRLERSFSARPRTGGPVARRFTWAS